MSERKDLEIIASLVPEGSRVLDLGCGDGALLEHLIRERGCDGHGIEVSGEGFDACVARGVPVLLADIDEGLSDLEDGAFDVVVLSQTLQATHRPAFVLHELMRVGRRGIVSFPNFGHWRLRLHLLLHGAMPVSGALPYAWHDTPNIHLCTIRDLEALVRAEGYRILRRMLLDEGGCVDAGRARLRPNLLAAGAVVEVGR